MSKRVVLVYSLLSENNICMESVSIDILAYFSPYKPTINQNIITSCLKERVFFVIVLDLLIISFQEIYESLINRIFRMYVASNERS